MKRHYTTNLYLLLNTDLVVLQASSMVLQDGETITGHCSGCTLPSEAVHQPSLQTRYWENLHFMTSTMGPDV